MKLSGAKGGGSSSFKQTPDNLRSEDTFEGVLGVGLGPFKGPKRGLKSIKVDGTRVENETGQLNFPDFLVSFADGDPLKHPQKVSLKLGAGASPIPVNLALSNVGGSAPIWVTRTVANTGAHFLDLRFIVSQMYRQDKKGVFDTSLTVEIQMKPTGSSTWINPTLGGGAVPYSESGYSVEDINGYVRTFLPRSYFNSAGTAYNSTSNYRITGKTTSPAVYELRISVPSQGAYANVQWDVRARLLERESYDNGSSTDLIKEERQIQWESIAAVYAGELGGKPGWEGVSWLQIYGKASDQLTGVPEITGEYETKIVPVPPSTIFDPATRVYTPGVWTGAWSYAYTDDPAWCIADLISDPIGGVSSFAPGSYLNKWDALEASKWFSEPVPNGAGGTHPRFSLNLALTDKQRADELIRYMAGAVGGLAWDNGNGEWRMRVDKPENAVDLFTLDNIIGDFKYQHTDIDTRYNDITGKFINAEMDYREDSVRLFDNDPDSPSAISKIGRKATTIALVGCTNRQEAMRRVMMRLRAACREFRVVNFMTNRRGKNINQLDTILVADGKLGDSNQRTTGRIVSISSDRKAVTVRDPMRLEVGVTYLLNFTITNPAYSPSPSTQPTDPDWTKPTKVISRAVTNSSGERGNVTTLHLNEALPANVAEYLPIGLMAEGLQTLPKAYRVLSVEAQDDNERMVISAIELDTGKWDAVDNVSGEDMVYVGLRGKPQPPLRVGENLIELLITPGERGNNVTLSATWQRPSDRRVAAFRVRHRVNGGQWILDIASTQITDFDLVNVGAGVYEIEITSLGRDGSVGGSLSEIKEISQQLISASYSDGTPIDALRPATPGATANVGRGFYSSTATYNPGDMVVWLIANGGDGRGYIRIGTGPTTGVAPSDVTKWEVIVERGEGGGPPGPEGPPGPQGPTGPAGPAGTSSDGLNVFVDAPSFMVPIYSNGAFVSWADMSTGLRVRAGIVDVTDSFSISISENPQAINTSINTATKRVTIIGTGSAAGQFGDPNVRRAEVTVQLTGVTGKYSGVVLTTKLVLTKYAVGIQNVSVLPTTNKYNGREVYNESDGRLYIVKAGVWTRMIDAQSPIEALQIPNGAVVDRTLGIGVGGNLLTGALPSVNPSNYVLLVSNLGGALYPLVLTGLPGYQNYDPTTAVWSPSDGSTFAIYQPNDDQGTAGYADFHMAYTKAISGQQSTHFPVTAEKTYEFSVYTGAHRCNISLHFLWINSAGDAFAHTTGDANGSNNQEKAGGTSLSDYKRIVVRDKAPAGAVAVVLVLRKGATVEPYTNSWAFYNRPMLCETAPNAVEMTPYSEPSLGLLRAEHVVAKQLTAEHMVSKTLTTEQLAVSTFTSGNLVPNPKGADGVTGWYVLSSPDGSVFSTATNFASAGDPCFTLTKTGPAFSIGVGSRAFPVKPGRTYAVSFTQSANAPTGNGLHLRIQVGNALDSQQNLVDPRIEGPDLIDNGPVYKDVTKRSFTWTAPANCSYAQFCVYNWVGGPTQFRFSDCEVEEQAGAVHIGNGAVKAEHVLANTFTGDVFKAGSIEASKMSVNQLSALTSDIGTMTAGRLRSVGGNADFDLTNARVTFNNGSYMKVIGNGFGSSGQFIEWFGPSLSDVSQCTEGNALSYATVNGRLYTSGEIASGVINDSARAFYFSSSAELIHGPLETNGLLEQTLTFGVHKSVESPNYSESAGEGTYSGTAIAERSIDGGAWTSIGTFELTGFWWQTPATSGGSGSVGRRYEEFTGSLNVVDTPPTSENVRYRLRFLVLNGPINGELTINRKQS